MERQIEYYGTLGPSCARKETLMKMLERGMTGIRLNLSHRSLKESEDWIKKYWEAAKKTGKMPELLIDLVGPEIRIGDLQKPLELKEGSPVFLITKGKKTQEDAIPVSQTIFEVLKEGQLLLLDDGKIEIQVLEQKEETVCCQILRGGILHGRKSLAIPGVSISNPTLTGQDYENLKEAKKYGVTAVMLPFVRNKEDLICLREALVENQAEEIRIFAKIENLDGVRKLPELLPYCDCVVIARGDLGNAVPLSRLPVIQQQIEQVCREEGKPFMVVTQMLQSMMDHAVPTRAEVNDIFHAIVDGASSVMLTGETAAGAYPVEAMSILVETGQEALKWSEKIDKKS